MPNLQEKLKRIKARSVEEARAAFGIGNDVYLMRDGWEETDSYLLIDCRTLALEAAAGGKALLVNEETANSTNYVYRGAAGNNLIVDENLTNAFSENLSSASHSEAKKHLWISQDRFDFFEGSRSLPASSENPIRHTRSVLFVKNDYWIMRDFVESRGEHDYALNFLFGSEVSVEIEDSQNGVLCAGAAGCAGDGWRMAVFGDNGGWQRPKAEAAPVNAESREGALLRFVSRGCGAQEFFTFFLPAPQLREIPEVLEATVRGGRAFLVKYQDYFDFFVFTDEEQIVRTEYFNTDFRFFWARMLAGDPSPEEFIMVDGTNFSLGAREIINYPRRVNFAVARRLGNRLNVRTNESLFKVSLPQKQSSMLILKNVLDA